MCGWVGWGEELDKRCVRVRVVEGVVVELCMAMSRRKLTAGRVAFRVASSQSRHLAGLE